MPDLRTDLEALRDEWSRWGHPYPQFASGITALLAKHAKAPAGPDLRAMVLAQYDKADGHSFQYDEGAQMVDGQWYTPKWGCDQLEYVLDSLAAAAPAEPVYKPSLITCISCGTTFATTDRLNGRYCPECHADLYAEPAAPKAPRVHYVATCACPVCVEARKTEKVDAPKAEEWRGPWKCEECGDEFDPGDNLIGFSHDEMPCWAGVMSKNICHGTLVPYERRKGGEG